MNKNGKVKCTLTDYHAHPAVGSSLLRILINQSPAHYLYAVDNVEEPTPSQIFGTAFHEAVLEPMSYKERLIVQPEFSGTGSRAARDEWHIKNHGRTILKQEQVDNIERMLKNVSDHKRASQLISDGRAEESLFWTDHETGIQCKARPDFIREGHILVDVKTTGDASYKSFQKDVLNYGYHIQAAMYLEAATTVLGQTFDTFIIIAVEKEAPFAVQCFQFNEDTLREGQMLYYAALKALKKCRDSGEYPAYGNELTPIGLPSYGFKGEER